MVCVERILEYSELPSEAALESPEKLKDDWPEVGEIIFDNVSLKYNEDGPPVLHCVTFTIAAGEKVIIIIYDLLSLRNFGFFRLVLLVEQEQERVRFWMPYFAWQSQMAQ